jgi:hypothetical protein
MEKNKLLSPKTISPEIDEEIITKVRDKFQEEKQVIVHCYFKADSPTEIRIWKSTYLCDNHSSHRSTLLNSYNISLYPVWMPVIQRTTIAFTLVFSGLPSTCTSFDLFEDCYPQVGGFHERNIQRTKSDIYSIWVG